MLIGEAAEPSSSLDTDAVSTFFAGGSRGGARCGEPGLCRMRAKHRASVAANLGMHLPSFRFASIPGTVAVTS